MTADKSYLAVPALTGFTIVRGNIKEAKEYTNNATGQSLARIETGARRFDAILTTYQPVVKVVEGVPVIVRYTDLGNDEFSFPDEVPTAQEEAGGPVVVGMAEALDADVLKSLRDVLIEVMTGSIPDFASQPQEMAAIGVPRHFHIDRIEFAGRSDRAKEASLKVLLGVYEDAVCTKIKQYIQQDFVSSEVIAEKETLKKAWQDRLSANITEATSKDTSVERKKDLTNEAAALGKQIEAITTELDDLQPLSLVVNKPAAKSAIREITESVLTHAKVVKPASYGAINIEALMGKFDASYAELTQAIAKA